MFRFIIEFDLIKTNTTNYFATLIIILCEFQSFQFQNYVGEIVFVALYYRVVNNWGRTHIKLKQHSGKRSRNNLFHLKVNKTAVTCITASFQPDPGSLMASCVVSGISCLNQKTKTDRKCMTHDDKIPLPITHWQHTIYSYISREDNYSSHHENQNSGKAKTVYVKIMPLPAL